MPPSLLPPTPEELEELRLRRRASQLKGYGEGADDPTAQALLNVRRNLGEIPRAIVGAKPYDETNPTGSYRAVQALMNAPTPAAIIPEAAQAAGKAATALSGLGALGVIKPKGGNWLAGSIERALKPMKNEPIISGELIDAASDRELFKEYQQSYKKDPTVGLVEWTRKNHPEVYDDLLRPEEAAINNWIDTKLGKYIRNEMATPEDPVRALAERGVLHVDPEAGLYHGRRAVHPSGEVFDKLGQSEAAKSWENASDYMVSSSPAEIYQNFGSSNLGLDWVNKLDPSTPFYSVRNTAGPELGFNHLIDELTNAASPDSDLPRSLQLSPEKLQKVTVPQAVELVDKINKWRAEEAVKAERAGMLGNLQATPRITDDSFQLSFVGKPGGAWVDIPETVTDKGMKLCSSIGKAGGWCTQAEWAAKSYGSGENRLTALVDTEGRPHVQAKITSIVDDTGAFDAVIDDLTPTQEAAWDAHFGASNGPPELTDALGWLQEHAPNVYKKYQDVLASQPKEPPDITELKPVGNSFKSERAQEYGKRDPEYFRKVENAVLKFLNSGKWGKVKDLDLYGIVDLQRDPVNLMAYLRDITKQDSRAAQALFNQAVDRNPNAPRFMTGRQLREFVGPTEGYAAGGAVRMKDGGKPPKRRASDLPGYGEGSAGALSDVVRGFMGEKPAEPTNPSELFRLAQALGAFPPVAGAVGAVKRPAGAAAALRELLKTEAPAQSAAAREALRRAYRTGHEHSVVGLTEAGVPGEVVTSGNRTRVIPSAADVSRAVSDPQRRAIVDFHTHPSDVSGLRVSPSADDVAFYADYERGAWPRTLKTFIASPPSTGGGRTSTAYSFFETDVPRRVYNKDLFKEAELELQNAGRLGRFDRVRRDPAFAAAFESGAVDLQDLLGEAAPLLLLERRAAQGAGRQRLDLGANAVAPNAELRDFYEMIREPAQEFLKKNKLKKGGAVKIETNPTLMADELLFKGHKRR